MALHHATLKAAVARYEPLFTEGKTEEEVKEAIKSDEKGFDEEAVNEIYAAITSTEAKEAPKGKYVVIQEFRDIVDFSKVHKVGDDVSDMDPKRLSELVESQLVAKQD